MKPREVVRVYVLIAMIAVTSGSLGACRSERPGAWAGTIVDSAGIELVTNLGDGLWTEGAGWTVREELRIGARDGDASHAFGSIAGVGVTSNGSIVTLDRQAAEVVVFTEDGTLERRFGRAGQGPGELGPGSGPLLVVPGDTILVPDLNNGRVNRYTREGEALESYSIRGGGIPMRWQVTAGGLVAVQTRPPPTPDQADSIEVVLTRLPSGAIADTVLSFVSGKPPFFVRGQGMEFNWFVAQPSWTMAEDGGIWFSAGEGFRFERYERGGELTRIVNQPHEARPVTRQDESLFREALESAWEEAGVPAALLPAARQAAHVEEYFPAFAQFVAGPKGTLMVQRVRSPSELTGAELASFRETAGRDGMFDQLRGLKSHEWDVFDRVGRYLGVLQLPPRFQPAAVVDERVYGVWRDELDVEYVVRLRLASITDQ